MRVFISLDMEGTSGLERLEEIFRGLPGYDTFRQIMAGDANAMIRGAVDAGADDIVASDSHGYMSNMRAEDLVPGVRLKSGLVARQWCQMKGFDEQYDVALLGCCHAKAGTSDAIISHTWIPGFREVRVNGTAVTEAVLNAYLAGAMGVPVAFLSGCDRTIEQSRSVLGDIEYAQVKKSTGYYSGEHLPLAKSRPLLRDKAKRAVERARELPLVTCELPVTFEVDMSADPIGDPPLGARAEDNGRYIDRHYEGGPLSDVELVLATHPEVTSPKTGTISFTFDNYPKAYSLLHAVLNEIYERDIENLIDVCAEPDKYERPDLKELIGKESLNARELWATA